MRKTNAKAPSMINIRLAVSLAALLAAGWLGYRWGSSGLEKARDELAAIAQTGSAAQADKEASQKRIDAQLKAMADAHEAKLKAMTADFDAQKQELTGHLGRANERLGVLGKQRQDVAVKLVETRRDILVADPADKEALRQLELRLADLDAKLKTKEEGIRCEAVPVPDTELATLNRVLAQP
jgi:hypothetical protein